MKAEKSHRIGRQRRRPRAARLLGCALAAAVIHASHVHGQDIAPRFPQSRITPSEWAVYLDEVKAKPSAEIINRPDVPDVTQIAVPAEHTMYYFTRSGPAHPAVIVVQVVSRDGAVFVRHNGHFAGSEPDFARWFLEFTRRVDELRRGMEPR